MGGGALPPHLMDYYPVCEWPYINKGWMNDGEEGFDDVGKFFVFILVQLN